MAQAIPASALVSVIPGVLSAGGRALDMNGLFLTTDPAVPVGSVIQFPSPASVAGFFGATAPESLVANTYFLGFDNSQTKPGALLFSRYALASVGAWLRGGVSTLTLAQLQALSGSLTVSIDGAPVTAASINLTGVTSFSAAARLIAVGLSNAVGPLVGTATGSIATTVLTVTGTPTAPIAVGQLITGGGTAPGTYITSLGTGTGGAGTYNVSTSNSVASTTLNINQPGVFFDTQRGAFQINSGTAGATSALAYATGTLAASLGLTAATGATLSQGSIASVPAAVMARVVSQTQNFATFSHVFDPDGGSGNALKLAFAAWNNSQGNRYLYVPWDTDATPTAVFAAAIASLGYLCQTTNVYSGIAPMWSPTQGANVAAFLMSIAASTDFTRVNGRVTAKFRTQSGLAPDVTDLVTYQNLVSNGYGCFASFSTANQQFNMLTDGAVTGPFAWFDTYINEIWLTNQMQLALMVLVQAARSIPYNQDGYGQIRAALLDPINQAVTFGAIRSGVTLSQSQIAQINNSVGFAVDRVINATGWYLYIGDALPQVRQARQSPPISLYYTDGGSIHKISLNSVTVQ